MSQFSVVMSVSLLLTRNATVYIPIAQSLKGAIIHTKSLLIIPCTTKLLTTMYVTKAWHQPQGIWSQLRQNVKRNNYVKLNPADFNFAT